MALMVKTSIDYDEMTEKLSEILPDDKFSETISVINKYLDDYITVSYIEEYMKYHDPVCQLNLTNMIVNYRKGVDPDGCKR